MKLYLMIVLLFFGLGAPVLGRPNPEGLDTDSETEADDSVEGPAKELPIHDNSEQMPVDTLLMEHRHNVEGNMILPNTMGIEDRVFEQLGVDIFFSMWFVFLNNDVTISDQAFTILAPINSTKTSPEALLKSEALTEEVIANHIVLGEEVRPESLVKNVDKVTIGGLPLKFKIDKNGELWVNEAKIIGWTQVKNGIIYAVDDYLFTKDLKSTDDVTKPLSEAIDNEISQDLSDIKTKVKTTTTTTTTTTTITTTPTTTTTTTTTTTPFVPPDHWVKQEKCHVIGDQGSLFKSILVCVEEFVDPATLTQTVDKSKEVRRDEFIQQAQLRRQLPDDETRLPNFLQDIVDVLSVLRFGSNDFLRYIQNEKMGDTIKDDANYTAIIPFDEAFRTWTPVDWGFNPFDVDGFVRDTLANHFLVGVVDQNTVENGATFKTVGGKDVTFTREDGKLRVNNIDLVEGGTPVPHGALLFINELLFVDDAKVSELENEYGYLETGPLIIEPWPESQFLSHVYELISKREEYTYMTEYLNKTPEIGDFAPPTETKNLEDGYTFFVPRDDAFWRLFVQDATAPDPFTLDDEFRLETLKHHLVKGRLFAHSMKVGHEIETMSGKIMTVIKKTGENITLSDGKQEIQAMGKERYVYNLGTMFYLDRVPFTETSDVLDILKKYDDQVIQDDEPVEDFSSPADTEDFEAEEEHPVETERVLFNIEAVGRGESSTEGEVEQPRKNRKDTAKEKDDVSVDVEAGEVNFPVFEDPENLETKRVTRDLVHDHAVKAKVFLDFPMSRK
eukprot:maker-scaffold469_size162558-snap-gene-0.30 protein:Tk06427 transcript:maker-scaffold469_size162558-snap-gene-0.30-mRNA-1 annotation:"hypothetical protein DAPPUDRAFT_309902"